MKGGGSGGGMGKEGERGAAYYPGKRQKVEEEG